MLLDLQRRSQNSAPPPSPATQQRKKGKRKRAAKREKWLKKKLKKEKKKRKRSMQHHLPAHATLNLPHHHYVPEPISQSIMQSLRPPPLPRQYRWSRHPFMWYRALQRRRAAVQERQPPHQPPMILPPTPTYHPQQIPQPQQHYEEYVQDEYY